jgi:hypothetical protein
LDFPSNKMAELLTITVSAGGKLWTLWTFRALKWMVLPHQYLMNDSKAQWDQPQFFLESVLV